MTNILLARGSPCPRQSRHCESGLLEQMSTLYCYKVKASACSGNQQFKLISKEYRFTYKYIFCARKASRIFHRYALYIEVSAVARGKRSVFPERYITSPFKSKVKFTKASISIMHPFIHQYATSHYIFSVFGYTND